MKKRRKRIQPEKLTPWQMSGCWNATCLLYRHSALHQQGRHCTSHPGTFKWAANALTEEKDGIGPRTRSLHSIRRPPVRTTHLPSPHPPCPPLHFGVFSCQKQPFYSRFLFLICFHISLPNGYLVCGSFSPRHIHLHFSMMIRILSLPFPFP